jgi:TolB-like protein/Flp pilus assembly protein TadD
MALGESLSETSVPRRPPEDRLDSWKEIAAHLNRDVTTVQRWEKREGMPVHRHVHDKRGSVYALASELDAWIRARKMDLEQNRDQTPATPGDDPGERARSWRWNSRQWLLLFGSLLLGLLVTTVIIVRHHATRPARPTITSLAVLPLKNLSGDSTQDYLADGMTEALIGRLSGIRGLRVVSHTSVMQFKNPQLSVPEIARVLGVDAIVEGSVIRQGSRVRVSAQLIQGSTDEHFWSATYDRELQDALALQSELAQSIAEKVEVTVSATEQRRLAVSRPVAPEVYESYLKGRFVGKTDSRSGVEQSIGYFQDAINKDPTFAPAYVGLAEAFSELGTVFIGVPPEDTRPKVVSAARKALELDPELANAHVLLAGVYQEQWRWADAEAEYNRALQLNPNGAGAHVGFAMWLLCQGRTDEALTWAQRGRQLDPMAVSGDSIGSILFQSRRYDDAIHELRSVLAVRPDNASALWDLGFVLIENKQPAEAIPVLEKAASVSERSPGVLGVLIAAYTHAGRRRDALLLLSELKNRRQAGYVPAGAFVNAYLGLDEKELAFAALEQAYKEQSNLLQFVKVHPFFDPLRTDPRFAELVRRVGLA